MNRRIPNTIKPLLLPISLNSSGLFFVNFIIPVIAHQQFSADGRQMGILFSLQALGSGISALLFSKPVNKWKNRALLILVASILKALAYVILYSAIIFQNYNFMILSTLILGFGSGLFLLVWQTCFAQESSFHNRAEVFGAASKYTGIGLLWGSCFAFTIISFAENLIWPISITYISLIFFAVACLAAGIISNSVIGSIYYDKKEMKSVILKREKIELIAVFLLLLMFFSQLSGSLVAPFLEVYLLTHLHLSSIVELSMAYIPGGIISMILAPQLGRVADKMNSAIFLWISGMTGAFTTWLMLQSSTIYHIGFLFIIDATVITASGLVLKKLISEIAGKKKGSALGLHGFINNTGQIAGPVIGGFFWQVSGSKGPFTFSISTELVMAFSCILFLWPLMRNSKVFCNAEKK